MTSASWPARRPQVDDRLDDGAQRSCRFGFAQSPRFGSLAKLANDKSGVATIEYALLSGLIAMAILGGVAKLGDKVGDIWTNVAETVAEAMDTSPEKDGKDKKDKKDKKGK